MEDLPSSGVQFAFYYVILTRPTLLGSSLCRLKRVIYLYAQRRKEDRGQGTWERNRGKETEGKTEGNIRLPILVIRLSKNYQTKTTI
jgi:hypothetical protein